MDPCHKYIQTEESETNLGQPEITTLKKKKKRALGDEKVKNKENFLSEKLAVMGEITFEYSTVRGLP